MKINSIWQSAKTDFIFRLGLGLIFLSNSLTAWFSPEGFKEIISSSFASSILTNTDFWVALIGINDGLVFLLLLSGRYRKAASIWMGIWLVTVTAVTGFNTPDFAEHFGILALAIFYANKPTHG